ncbi:RTA1-domain-containing protein [Mycena pura]|uniref:RTA1-domain-containing protein n=1 Tax=Mycena pura TaxID=153505 RepID=A0AAD6V6F1_9AGAR|nr:RTA1-domain-containing protein [Mycena pura]
MTTDLQLLLPFYFTSFLRYGGGLLGQRSSSIEVENSQREYVPHEYVAIIFLVLFGISTILHTVQATYYRMWWLFPTAIICGLGEIIGWSGDLWAALASSSQNPFMMQFTSTVLAPTPLVAVNFILLSWTVTRLGSCYSRLAPIWYAIILLSCDILALIVQIIGGGIASSATAPSFANSGANIMLTGVILQFAVFFVYSLLFVDVLRCYHMDLPVRTGQDASGRSKLDSKLKTMIAALAFTTLVLFIRSVYRIIQLAGGWSGHMMYAEVDLAALDGGMVVLVMFAINVAHPGRLLGESRSSPSHRDQQRKTYAHWTDTPSGSERRAGSTRTLMAQAVV